MSPVHPIATPDPRPTTPPAAAAPQAGEKPVIPAASPAPSDASIEPPPATAAQQKLEKTAGGGIRTGLWQFTTHLAGAAAPAGSTGTVSPDKTDGIAATYTSCIRSEDAVPAGFGGQCKLDHKERNGATITWSMTCAETQARSEGVAHYHGNTMEATVEGQLPGADGKTMKVTQHVTGRYLGECLATAALPLTPTEAAAKTAATEKGTADTEATAPQTATAPIVAAPKAAEPGEAEAEPEARTEHTARHTPRRAYRHYVYRHYYGGASAGFDRGASFAGPAPYSNAGP